MRGETVACMHDDDLDSLLAEIEGTLDGGAGGAVARPATKVSSGTAAPRPAPSAQVGQQRLAAPALHHGSSPHDDIDSLLAELGDELGDAAIEPSHARLPRSAHPAAPAATPPRSLTIAAGSLPAVPGLTYGRTNLRCTRCDFRVMRFRGRRWSPAVDYMFLRNWMPDAAKMLEVLVKDDGKLCGRRGSYLLWLQARLPGFLRTSQALLLTRRPIVTRACARRCGRIQLPMSMGDCAAVGRPICAAVEEIAKPPGGPARLTHRW